MGGQKPARWRKFTDNLTRRAKICRVFADNYGRAGDRLLRPRLWAPPAIGRHNSYGSGAWDFDGQLALILGVSRRSPDGFEQVEVARQYRAVLHAV